MKPKTFICFSTNERQQALALYRELADRGADVFQFEETASPGTEAWNQVLDAIESSDYFIALLSRSALDSKPVMHEIEYAHYRYANHRRPVLIPVKLEKIEPPKLMRMFTTLPATDIAAAFEPLAELMGLASAPAVVAEPPPPPRPAEPRALPRITALLTAKPASARVGQEVIWQARVSNDGEVAVQEVAARLSGRPLTSSFSLAPGESRSFEKSSTFKVKGEKTRTLAVEGVTADGTQVVSRSQAVVTVKEATLVGVPMPRLGGVGGSPSTLTKRLRLDDDEFRRLAAGAPAGLLESKALWVGIVLLLGAAATLASFATGPWLLGFLPDSLGGFEDAMDWIAARGWARWSIVLLGTALVVSVAFGWSDEWIIPVEGLEYAGHALFTCLLVHLGMQLPALLLAVGYSSDELRLLMTAGVGLAAVSVTWYTIVDW